MWRLGTWIGLVLALGCGVVSAAPKTLGIFVGNNSFPALTGRDLRGCVNDANLLAGTFRQVWGEVEERRLYNVSVGEFVATLRQAVDRCRSGEVRRLVITISSHGTTIPGAEADGAGEAVVFSDVDADMTRGLLTDRELRGMLDQIPPSVGVELLLDTCFSGGATRGLKVARAVQPMARYLPHPRFRPGVDRVVRRKSRSAGPEHMAEWAAAGETELAWDDALAGRYQGVFTYVWVRNFLSNPTHSRAALIGLVKDEVGRGGYEQTPQLLTR